MPVAPVPQLVAWRDGFLSCSCSSPSELDSGASASLSSGSNFGLAGGVGYFENRAATTMSFIGRIGERSYVSAGVGVGLDSGTVGARGGFQVEW